MDQIGEYLMSSWVTGLVGVSLLAAAVAIFATWVFNQFFEILENDEKGADK